jgi:hypothetical protein
MGYSISFGTIGRRTTYALLVREDGQEVVGYTYMRGPMEQYNELLGQYKALSQAEARRILISNDEISVPEDLPRIQNVSERSSEQEA